MKRIKKCKLQVIKKSHGNIMYSIGSAIDNMIITIQWQLLDLVWWSFWNVYKY